jgi:hypothetical protein
MKIQLEHVQYYLIILILIIKKLQQVQIVNQLVESKYFKIIRNNNQCMHRDHLQNDFSFSYKSNLLE